MVTNDLYAISLPNLGAARVAIENRLNISFVPRESSYLGVYFQCRTIDSEKFILRWNSDPIDGEPVEPQFSNEHVLLYVDGTKRALNLRSLLLTDDQIFRLLRTDVGI